MLRAWTRSGQLELIEELALLARQADRLASQERAVARGGGPAGAVYELLVRSRPVLSRLQRELSDGASPRDTRRELSILYSLVAREVARAEALRHGSQR